MHPTIRRVLLYTILAAALYLVATFFAKSQIAFVTIFAIGLAADLMFLTHLLRLPWSRRRQQH